MRTTRPLIIPSPPWAGRHLGTVEPDQACQAWIQPRCRQSRARLTARLPPHWAPRVKPTERPNRGLTLEGRPLVGIVLAACLLLTGCGRTKPAAQAIDDWVRAWRGEVRISQRPNRFSVPRPPTVALPTVADDLGRNVEYAANRFSDYIEVAYDETKNVFCTWFAWYVETGHTVPDHEEFQELLLRYGFGLVLNRPPSQQFQDAVELFRTSIENAQSEGEQVRNAAIAAACSIP